MTFCSGRLQIQGQDGTPRSRTRRPAQVTRSPGQDHPVRITSQNHPAPHRSLTPSETHASSGFHGRPSKWSEKWSVGRSVGRAGSRERSSGGAVIGQGGQRGVGHRQAVGRSAGGQSGAVGAVPPTVQIECTHHHHLPNYATYLRTSERDHHTGQVQVHQ